MILPTSDLMNSSTPYSEALNNTNNTKCPTDIVFRWMITVIPVYILVVCVLGILLNAFVLMVFCLHKKPCTVSEIYLSNLATADLILMSSLPFVAVYISHDFDWPFGQFMCKVVRQTLSMNRYCSIYFLVLISIDRYVAIVHPMSNGRMRRPKYAKLFCLLVWGFGLILCIPKLIFTKIEYFPEGGTYGCLCNYPNLTTELLIGAMLIVLGIIIPLLIIAFCTIKIIQALRIKALERSNANKTKEKATTLMLVVLFAFLICWVPHSIVDMLYLLFQAEILGGCQFTVVLYFCDQIFFYLTIFHSVLNPILYVIVGKNFQKKVVPSVLLRWLNNTGEQTQEQQSDSQQHFTCNPNNKH